MDSMPNESSQEAQLAAQTECVRCQAAMTDDLS
jgi:hypothetical protein